MVICGSPAPRDSLYSVLGALTQEQPITASITLWRIKYPMYTTKSHITCASETWSRPPQSFASPRSQTVQVRAGPALAETSCRETLLPHYPVSFFTALVSNSRQEAVSLRMPQSTFVIPVPLLTMEGTRLADGSFCPPWSWAYAYLVSIMHFFFEPRVAILVRQGVNDSNNPPPT